MFWSQPGSTRMSLLRNPSHGWENAMGVQEGKLSDLYGQYYFTHYSVEQDGEHAYQRDQHWLAFFGQIADHISREIAPRTVLDAGCAMGLLVEALRDRG